MGSCSALTWIEWSVIFPEDIHIISIAATRGHQTTLKLRFTLDILSVIALNRRVSEVSSESSVHVEHSFRSKCKRTNVPLLTTLQETQSFAFFRHTTQFWFLHCLWKSKKLVHSTSLLTICFISACTGSSVASYISLGLDNISRQTLWTLFTSRWKVAHCSFEI